MYDKIADKLLYPLLLMVIGGVGTLVWAWIRKRAAKPKPKEHVPVQVDRVTRLRQQLASLEDEPSPEAMTLAEDMRLAAVEAMTTQAQFNYVDLPGLGLTVIIGSKRWVGSPNGDPPLAVLRAAFELLREHGSVKERVHIDLLVESKRNARKGRASDRLTRAAPTVEKLLRLLAERGANLGSACAQLLRLLDEHGHAQLERAAQEALLKEMPEPRSVRLILDRMRLDEDRPMRVPVHLPDDPRIKDLVVRPHSLETYDVLGQGRDAEEEQTDEEQ